MSNRPTLESYSWRLRPVRSSKASSCRRNLYTASFMTESRNTPGETSGSKSLTERPVTFLNKPGSSCVITSLRHCSR